MGVNIKIEKIPTGSGLGGGSSNAASTLIALNRLWNLNLSKDELMNIAKKIGADVPFFVMEKMLTDLALVISLNQKMRLKIKCS